MNLYLDTSALAKVYIREVDADLVRAAVKRADVVATARIAWAELLAAFARREREGKNRYLARARIAFLRDWQELAIINHTPALDRIISDLLSRHPLRGFDVVHLASAVLWRQRLGAEITFACADERLRAAALAEGFALLP